MITMITSRVLNSTLLWKRLCMRSLSTIWGSKSIPAPEAKLPLLKSVQLRQVLVPIVPSFQHPLNKIQDLPQHNVVIESPRSTLINEINDILRKDVAEAPAAQTNVTEIRAARLIVIRRRKMKKHKLRKLRKRMKFEWAKVRQRREMRKEKAFQAELLAQIKEAGKFSAEEYVSEKLRKANETPIPRYWKGRRLPQDIIKQKLGIK